MDIQIGDKAVVLRGSRFCQNPLEAGEIVRVIESRLLKSGQTDFVVRRDCDTALHHFHTSELVAVAEGRSITEMSVAELVNRFFAIESAVGLISYNLPEYDLLNKQMDTIFDALPTTPSRTHKDIIAKLQFAADFAAGDCRPWLTDFLNTLGDDYDRAMDRVDEEESTRSNADVQCAAE